MNARIYIPIPVHNRRRIVEQCIPTIYGTKLSCDTLEIWNDASTEFDNQFLSRFADTIEMTQIQRGIEAQRRAHFIKFWNMRHTFSHIYMTDSDAPHDPNWRSQALGLQRTHNGLPVCLYDTKAHSKLQGNTVEDDPTKDYIVRRVMPGISYLLTVAHVERIMAHIQHLQDWDWFVPSILGHRCIISRTSHCDHIGLGGLHHPSEAGLDDGDRAENPTAWLKAKRAEIVEELSKP